MIDSEYRIMLDIHSAVSNVCLYVKKADTSRKICVTLSENGFPYHISDECYAAFTATKPDGNILFNDCTIEDDVIIYKFTPQTAAVSGLVKCEIKLYGADDGLITSPSFLLMVGDTAYEDGVVIESEKEVSALTALISDATTVINKGNEVNIESEELIRELEENRKELAQNISETQTHAEKARSSSAAALASQQAAQKSEEASADSAEEAKNSAEEAKNSAEEAKKHDGATFTPVVSEEGTLSWTNDKGLENPAPVNIKGPKGDIGVTGPQGIQGEKGEQGDTGATGAAGKDGTSPTVAVSAITGGHRFAIIDVNGTQTVDVMDGEDGVSPKKGVDYWTDADKESIIQEVITALGTPVFGTVDGENNIILTGELADGTYSLKYEDADGNQTDIGSVVIGTGSSDPDYINQIPISTDTDGSVYNGVGYKEGTRISSSSGSISSNDSVDLTGFIPVAMGNIIRMKDVDFVWDTVGSNGGLHYYSADKKTKLISYNISQYPSGLDDGLDCQYDDAGNLVQFTVTNYGGLKSPGYLRVCASNIDAASIITVNQEIV